MQIAIRNFQIIQEANIDVEGIVLIVGVNNSGKTSIQRALKALILNQASEGNVRLGTSAFHIGVKDGDHEIVFVKSLRDGNLFKINNVDHRKVGRDKISKLYPAFDIKEMSVSGRNILPNFIFYGEVGFPFNMTDNEIYEVFYRYMGLGTVEEIGEEIREEIKRLKKERLEYEGAVEYIESGLKDTNEKLKGYEPEIWYEQNRDRLVIAFRAYEQIEGYKGDLDSVRGQLDLVETRLKRFEGLKDVDFKPIDVSIGEFRSLEVYLKEIQGIDRNVKEKSGRVDRIPEQDFEPVDEVIKDCLAVEVYKLDLARVEDHIQDRQNRVEEIPEYDFKEFDEVIKANNNLITIQTAYNDIVSEVAATEIVLEGFDPAMKDIEDKLKDVKACPLCGRAFDE